MAKVLMIEDDPLVVRMYQKVMSFEGFEIHSAPDGREGIRKAKELKPDLIFCDIMMPKMNGIEVLEHLKADPELQHIPVIMLTNLSGTHDAETAMKKGAFSYMVKSEFRPKEVAAKAKEFVKAKTTQPAAPSAAPLAPVGTPPIQAVPSQPTPTQPTPTQPTPTQQPPAPVADQATIPPVQPAGTTPVTPTTPTEDEKKSE